MKCPFKAYLFSANRMLNRKNFMVIHNTLPKKLAGAAYYNLTYLPYT